MWLSVDGEHRDGDGEGIEGRMRGAGVSACEVNGGGCGGGDRELVEIGLEGRESA